MTTDHGTPPYGYTPPPPPRAGAKKTNPLLVVLLIVGAVVAVLCCGGLSIAALSGDNGDPKAAPSASSSPATSTSSAPAAPAVKPTTAPAKPPAAATVAGDGTYEVPREMQPGRWESAALAPDQIVGCSWQRLSNTSGDFNAIIAGNYTKGKSVVTIAATDKAFKSEGCNDWVRLGG